MVSAEDVVGQAKKYAAFSIYRSSEADKMLGTHNRLNLLANQVAMLKLHDDLKMERTDEEHLDRILRLSDAICKVIRRDITHCNRTMIRDPSKAENCKRMIRKFIEMQKIGNMQQRLQRSSQQILIGI